MPPIFLQSDNPRLKNTNQNPKLNFNELNAKLGGSESQENWAPHSTLQIGYTYEEAGEKEKAIKSLQLVCKRYPTSADASQAHAYLQDKYKINQTFGGDTGKDE